MKRTWPLLLGLALPLGALCDTGAADAGEFQKAPDGCKHAHAILGWSDFKQGKDESDADFEERKKRPWVKMGWVIGRLNWGREEGKEQLKVVSEYEPGVAQQASFRQYRVKGHDNALAYVAHCGHGGTCNMLASRLHNLYKGIGTPTVYCGQNAVPSMLTNPSTPHIPIPSDEELNEAGGGDDDLDFGDDDEGKKDDEPSADDF